MAKKRVHELAKEFGLENKEAVTRLQAAGLDVKSHSSSVYEEEARAVLQRDAAPVEAPAPATKRPGMMIVKKAKKDEEAAEAAQQVAAAAAEAAPEHEPAEPHDEEPTVEATSS